MAEFLIRIRDKEGHNPGLLGEREVVSVCPDGWVWSHLEQTSPDWRIVKVPGMTLEQGEVFTMPEPVDETLYVKRRRAFKVEVSTFAHAAAVLADDKRKTPTVEVPLALFEASKRPRIPMERREVIAPQAVIAKEKK